MTNQKYEAVGDISQPQYHSQRYYAQARRAGLDPLGSGGWYSGRHGLVGSTRSSAWGIGAAEAGRFAGIDGDGLIYAKVRRARVGSGRRQDQTDVSMLVGTRYIYISYQSLTGMGPGDGEKGFKLEDWVQELLFLPREESRQPCHIPLLARHLIGLARLRRKRRRLYHGLWSGQ